MKFTNEIISNADREKYQSMGIDFGIARYWTINQDRNIFLMINTNYREDPDFPPYKFNGWLFFWKGDVMKFTSRIYLRNDDKYKEDAFILHMVSSTIPEDKKEECFSLLKEALRIHGRYGLPSKTKPTNFIFEF